VAAAGVVAGGVLVLPVGGIRVRFAPSDGTPGKRPLGRVRRDDRVGYAEAAVVLRPPESLLVVGARATTLLDLKPCHAGIEISDDPRVVPPAILSPPPTLR